jgi:hypothetical protein
MKTLRQLCVASVFVFALAIPAFAGEIQTTVAPPQPAQTSTTIGQANGEIETTVTGQIETTSSGEASATDSATEIALNLLQSVLALF